MYLLCKRQEWKISHNEQRSIVRANRDARLDENATVALLSVLPPRSLNTQMKRAEEITRIITIIDFFLILVEGSHSFLAFSWISCI
jgi:hypothetical protein